MSSSGGGGGTPATTVTGPDAFGAASVVGTSVRYARQDHDHGLPAAPAVGLSFTGLQRANTLAETFPRIWADGNGNSNTSGFIQMMPIQIPTATVIGHIVYCSGTTAANVPSHYWFGLWDNNLNQLAVTADQLTAAWAANTEKSLAIATIASGASSTFTTTYTGLHYVGALVTASTVPTFIVKQNGGTNAEIGFAPILGGQSTNIGAAGPPAFPSTATALSGAFSSIYAYVAS